MWTNTLWRERERHGVIVRVVGSDGTSLGGVSYRYICDGKSGRICAIARRRFLARFEPVPVDDRAAQRKLDNEAAAEEATWD